MSLFTELKVERGSDWRRSAAAYPVSRSPACREGWVACSARAMDVRDEGVLWNAAKSRKNEPRCQTAATLGCTAWHSPVGR